MGKSLTVIFIGCVLSTTLWAADGSAPPDPSCSFAWTGKSPRNCRPSSAIIAPWKISRPDHIARFTAGGTTNSTIVRRLPLAAVIWVTAIATGTACYAVIRDVGSRPTTEYEITLRIGVCRLARFLRRPERRTKTMPLMPKQSAKRSPGPNMRFGKTLPSMVNQNSICLPNGHQKAKNCGKKLNIPSK